MCNTHVDWPGGARVAVMLIYDFDAETLWRSRDPDNARRPGVGVTAASVGGTLETLSVAQRA